MSSADVLLGLERWYADQCDGEWEHDYGVTIGTLDNPGWTVRIDLTGTGLSDRGHERVEDHRSDEDWLVAWRDEHHWHAACGAHNLAEALSAFLAWAR
jgi:Immunity protein 53